MLPVAWIDAGVVVVAAVEFSVVVVAVAVLVG